MATKTKPMPATTIVLRRQGTADTFLANLSFCSIEFHGTERCVGAVYRTAQVAESRVTTSCVWRSTLDDRFHRVLAHAAEAIWQRFGVQVRFDDDIEAYMYYDDATLRIWPRLRADVYFAAATYDPATDTIRHEPDNVVLLGFRDTNRADFSIDPGSKPYRDICREAFGEYLKEHNRRNSDRENKSWLAWLISETIKERIAGEHPVKLPNICRSTSN